MPQGDKSSYTDKQKRKAEHIEDGYRKRGVNKSEAEERAWRTVNKQDGGAKKKAGVAKKKSASKSPAKSSRPAGRKAAASPKRKTAKPAARKRAGK